jgi:hypothetical protein
LRQRAKPSALRQHWLEHRKHRVGGLGSGRVTHEISQFFATRIDGAHVATEIVHEDLRRIRTAIEDFSSRVFLVRILLFLHLVFHLHGIVCLVEEALHDADVFHVVQHFSCLCHIDPLEKSGFLGTRQGAYCAKSNAYGLLERAC